MTVETAMLGAVVAPARPARQGQPAQDPNGRGFAAHWPAAEQDPAAARAPVAASATPPRQPPPPRKPRQPDAAEPAPPALSPALSPVLSPAVPTDLPLASAQAGPAPAGDPAGALFPVGRTEATARIAAADAEPDTGGQPGPGPGADPGAAAPLQAVADAATGTGHDRDAQAARASGGTDTARRPGAAAQPAGPAGAAHPQAASEAPASPLPALQAPAAAGVSPPSAPPVALLRAAAALSARPAQGGGETPDSQGDGGRGPDRGSTRPRPPGTGGPNFSAAMPEMAPKRMQPASALSRGSAAGAAPPPADPATDRGGGVRGIGIGLTGEARFALRVDVGSAALAARIIAEAGQLRTDLAEVGAELDALRVEVAGRIAADGSAAMRDGTRPAGGAETGDTRNGADLFALQGSPGEALREALREVPRDAAGPVGGAVGGHAAAGAAGTEPAGAAATGEEKRADGHDSGSPGRSDRTGPMASDAGASGDAPPGRAGGQPGEQRSQGSAPDPQPGAGTPGAAHAAGRRPAGASGTRLDMEPVPTRGRLERYG